MENPGYAEQRAILAISNALGAMRASVRARETGDEAASHDQLRLASEWLIEASRAVHGVVWRTQDAHAYSGSEPAEPNRG